MGLTYWRGLLVFASKLSYRYIQPQSLNYIEESSHQTWRNSRDKRGKGERDLQQGKVTGVQNCDVFKRATFLMDM